MIKMYNSTDISKRDVYVSFGILLTVISGYFYLPGNYILVFQETRSLFLFSAEYFFGFLSKPGGILDYAARFLTQFYADRVIGPMILSVILTLPALILYSIYKKLIPGNSSALIFVLFPSLLLLVIQANYYHMMVYNLGFIVVMLFYLFLVSSRKQNRLISIMVLFPVFYFTAGAYAMIFALLFIIDTIVYAKGKDKYIYPAVLLIIVAVSFSISLQLVFSQTAEQLLFFPLPVLENLSYIIPLLFLTFYLVIIPIIPKVTYGLSRSRFNGKNYTYGLIAVAFSLTIVTLLKIYNPQTARVIELERLVFAEKWNEVIQLNEKKPSRNLIGEYFYNVALSETDQLCDRLFFSSQDFAAGSLVLPWGDAHLDRGAYFYYSIGLINEAHRWAYEEMVVYGNRPQNIRLLAKTNLINGDYIMTKKYTDILKKTIYYRSWAKKYEEMAKNPELIASDPELGAKRAILPKNSFFIQFNEPQNNLPLILEGQPDNKKAIEYYMAGLLLTKKIEIIVNNIRNLKASGFTRIPRHLEEALLIYYNSTKIVPDLGGLTINPATSAHFEKYFNSYLAARKNPATLKENMQKEFGNTFWYYFHFK